MESYKSNRPESKSLFTVVMALSVAWHFISIMPLSAQERVDIDTLWYRYHNSEQDYYPDLLPEDCYMELYLENGILKKGYFWGTTDEFEQAREGYECGYFVMPMTDIKQDKDPFHSVWTLSRPQAVKKSTLSSKPPLTVISVPGRKPCRAIRRGTPLPTGWRMRYK